MDYGFLIRLLIPYDGFRIPYNGLRIPYNGLQTPYNGLWIYRQKKFEVLKPEISTPLFELPVAMAWQMARARQRLATGT